VKKIFLGMSMAVCFVCGLIYSPSARAWLVDTKFDVDLTDSSQNTNSRNTDSRNSNNRDERDSRNNNSINLKNGRYTSTNLSNFNSNNRYDNRQDRSTKDSFNTYDYSDHSDRSVDNSQKLNYDLSSRETVGGSKRVDSNDISVGGDVKSSILGNFSQTYAGTDLRSGVTGSGNTIDARSINVTTFGDSTSAAQ